MNAIGLSQLAPLIAAIMGPMLAFIVASMRFQHLEAVKTRELISNSEKETRELISNSEKETRALISSLERETQRGLADVRERLARIEGRFGIVAPPSEDETDESGGSGPATA